MMEDKVGRLCSKHGEKKLTQDFHLIGGNVKGHCLDDRGIILKQDLT
jgi:hypothetical protein